MPLSGPDQLLYEKKGHVVVITMNRPERMNAINEELGSLLAEAWIKYDKDDDALCAVLTGVGDRAFSAGADLKDMNEGGGWGRSSNRRTHPFERSSPIHLNSWKPTIAAINGFAVAGGWLLAQYCDIRIASDTAKLSIPEVRWNLPYERVSDLKWKMSLGNLLEILLTGEQFSAQRCYEMGYVNHVVAPDQLMDKAMNMANIIADKAPMAVRMHKEAVYRSLDLNYDESGDVASGIMTPMRWSKDTVEGPKAFVEKRKPVWKNE